jgi:predicted cupin superfamily sugar epimerase
MVAASIPSEEGFSLVSCAIAPAFDFIELEMGNKEELRQLFPQHALIVERFCRLTS